MPREENEPGDILPAAARPGRLVAIEGIDGAGKATLARALRAQIEARGYPVCAMTFPDYTTSIGQAIRSFLTGEAGLNVRARQLLYAANRYERAQDISDELRSGRMVLCDRYTGSGLAYGLAQGLDLSWMIQVERDLPRPDAVILVEISVATSLNRSGMTDQYEKDGAFLEVCCAAYRRLAEGEASWHIVNGERSPNDVAGDAWEWLKHRIPAEPARSPAT